MKIVTLLALATTLVLAQNPKVFSAVGDPVYDNVAGINSLMNVDAFRAKKTDIQSYVNRVGKLKNDGFALEGGSKIINKGAHLRSLRRASRTSDKYVGKIKHNFKKAIKDNDSKLFVDMIDTGMISTTQHREKILNYYNLHSSEINPKKGVMRRFIDKHVTVPVIAPKPQKVKTVIKKRVSSKPTKKWVNANIRRIRKNDKAKHDAIKDKFDKEEKRTQESLKAYQKNELAR